MTDETTTPVPTLDELKAQAKQLRARYAVQNKPISHSKALEIIAHQRGHKDWNTLHALARGSNHVAPLRTGQHVSGTYLSQPFEAIILQVSPQEDGEHFDLVLDFDEPVDVVTFESFSAFRRQIRCTIDRSGKTEAHTSDGTPHMQLKR
ncbi:MAG: hypothetical protein COA52_06615 [Hyphomicrobiales bacterium]|nr:MAG: hypothetical protein COA52_06615 [Hyphomicrobiales bacterium]